MVAEQAKVQRGLVTEVLVRQFRVPVDHADVLDLRRLIAIRDERCAIPMDHAERRVQRVLNGDISVPHEVEEHAVCRAHDFEASRMKVIDQLVQFFNRFREMRGIRFIAQSASKRNDATAPDRRKKRSSKKRRRLAVEDHPIDSEVLLLSPVCEAEGEIADCVGGRLAHVKMFVVRQKKPRGDMDAVRACGPAKRDEVRVADVLTAHVKQQVAAVACESRERFGDLRIRHELAPDGEVGWLCGPRRHGEKQKRCHHRNLELACAHFLISNAA